MREDGECEDEERREEEENEVSAQKKAVSVVTNG